MERIEANILYPRRAVDSVALPALYPRLASTLAPPFWATPPSGIVHLESCIRYQESSIWSPSGHIKVNQTLDRGGTATSLNGGSPDPQRWTKP